MTPFAPALSLLIALATTPANAATTGPVRNADDARHLLVSFGATVQGSAGLRWLGLDRRDARIGAIALAGVLGVAKETWDATHGGRFDPLDLVWDAVGIGLGALMAGATR